MNTTAETNGTTIRAIESPGRPTDRQESFFPDSGRAGLGITLKEADAEPFRVV